MALREYEIISPLSNNNSFKVRHQTTNEYFMLRTIDCIKLKENEDLFVEKINKRMSVNHPNCLKFIDYFKESGMIYLILEYCPYGNLFDVIEMCHQENKQLREESISKIIYQIALALKILDYGGKLHIKHVFIDYDFNVKLYNFDFKNNKSQKGVNTSDLAAILYNLITLNKCDHSVKLIENNATYTDSLMNFLNYLLKTNDDLIKVLDEILCNQTILLMVSKWRKDDCFLNRPEESFSKKLKSLRQREQAVRIKEQTLREREHKLQVREKKVSLTERLVQEKLMQAELYLKRCRERKPATDNSEPIYAECDSPSIITSKKIAPFLRSRSERRIKFKGHSPLKELKCNFKGNKRNSLFGVDMGKEEISKPISWLDEDMKKQAFDLLKVLNGQQKENQEMKHTYL